DSSLQRGSHAYTRRALVLGASRQDTRARRRPRRRVGYLVGAGGEPVDQRPLERGRQRASEPEEDGRDIDAALVEDDDVDRQPDGLALGGVGGAKAIRVRAVAVRRE